MEIELFYERKIMSNGNNRIGENYNFIYLRLLSHISKRTCEFLLKEDKNLRLC